MNAHPISTIDTTAITTLTDHDLYLVQQLLEDSFSESELYRSMFYESLMSGIAYTKLDGKDTRDDVLVRMINEYPTPVQRQRLQHVFGCLEDGITIDLPKYESLSDAVKSVDGGVLSARMLDGMTRMRMLHVERYLNSVEEQSGKHLRLKEEFRREHLRNTLSGVNDSRNALMAFDVEAYEHNHDLVTEIGVSIYDPLRKGKETHIHVIVEEHQGLRNGVNVVDNKDHFLFGTSIVLKLDETVQLVQKLVDYYFDVRHERFGVGCIFVGHTVASDIRWLKTLGVELPKDMIIADSRKLFGLTHAMKYSSLENILSGLGLEHRYVHNAGNDACYALRLLMKLCEPEFRVEMGLDKPGALEEYHKRVESSHGTEEDMETDHEFLTPVTLDDWREAAEFIFEEDMP